MELDESGSNREQEQRQGKDAPTSSGILVLGFGGDTDSRLFLRQLVVASCGGGDSTLVLALIRDRAFMIQMQHLCTGFSGAPTESGSTCRKPPGELVRRH